MHELGLMERFADPALFDGLAFSEKAAGGLITTLMGMGTTFSILVLLWGAIALTSKLIIKGEQKAKAAAALKTQEATSIAVIPPAQSADSAKPITAAEAGNEIVAVLMAAIAASQGHDVLTKLRISKIQRISGSRPTWNAAGSADCVDSRKF